MSQSGFIAAMLLAAFIIWLAVNDRLQTYTAVLFGPTAQPKPQGNISTNNGVIAPSISSPAPSGGSGPAGVLQDLGTGVLDFGGSNLLPDASSGIAGLLEFLP